ncbi:MAG: RsmF rRNA methyltransferase first C-terminal domain-containing protein, partial [Anaerolineae bacterium]|nr:RsmF rRNA methyltransferase first C-terminal domain-containing protein [Anaerolineae bacterium]
PDRLAERWAGLFDAVLVDAPCSGEGTFARDPHAVRGWSVDAVQTYAHHQLVILEQTAPLVRLGGRLLYGTCTFAPEENEGVIAAFLEMRDDFELMDLPQVPGLHPGHPEWLGLPAHLRRAGRFWPHKGPGHGHFYALLRRKGDPADPLPERWRGSDVPGRVLALYRQRVGEALVGAPPESGLLLDKEDALYIAPLAPELWRGLRVLRPGWWVATRRHNKVTPNHALAMALRPAQAREVLDLRPDDPHLSMYLQGSSWPDTGTTEFVLITVDGFPLGWARRTGGRMRSHYPIHLRR